MKEPHLRFYWRQEFRWKPVWDFRKISVHFNSWIICWLCFELYYHSGIEE